MRSLLRDPLYYVAVVLTAVFLRELNNALTMALGGW
jgi:hypothetical protein